MFSISVKIFYTFITKIVPDMFYADYGHFKRRTGLDE